MKQTRIYNKRRTWNPFKQRRLIYFAIKVVFLVTELDATIKRWNKLWFIINPHLFNLLMVWINLFEIVSWKTLFFCYNITKEEDLWWNNCKCSRLIYDAPKEVIFYWLLPLKDETNEDLSQKKMMKQFQRQEVDLSWNPFKQKRLMYDAAKEVITHWPALCTQPWRGDNAWCMAMHNAWCMAAHRQIFSKYY